MLLIVCLAECGCIKPGDLCPNPRALWSLFGKNMCALGFLSVIAVIGVCFQLELQEIQIKQTMPEFMAFVGHGT
jgi:hypothetical protein